MATNKPRVNVVLDKQIYELIKRLSEEEGTSLSSFVKDLIEEALELREDVALNEIAEEREKTFNKSKALPHNEIWK
jgi:predicted DNA-binding protein